MQDAINSLDRLRSATGVDSDSDLARRLGVAIGTVASWRSRGSVPASSMLAACRRLGLSFDEITGTEASEGVTDRASRTDPEHPTPQPESALVEIPLLVDISAQASESGTGFLVDSDYFEVEPSGVFLPDSYIRQVYGVSPDRVLYIHSRGRSMVPTIMPGQRVMIALLYPGASIRDGLIYVINYAAAPLGGVLVKRLELLPDHVNVVSDNDDVEDYQVPFEVWQRDYQLRAVVLETAIRH